MDDGDGDKKYTKDDVIMLTTIPIVIICYGILLYFLITKLRKWPSCVGGDTKDDLEEMRSKEELHKMEEDVKKRHGKLIVKEAAIRVEHAKVLGAGQFSAVFMGYLTAQSKDPAEPKAVYRKKEHKVAVKQVNQQTPANHAALLKEGKEMSDLVHPQIVALRGLCLHSPFGPMIIMEFLDGGSLKTHLTDVRAGFLGPFSYNDAKRVLCDVAAAVAFLHEKSHVHRDLAARNVLLSDRNLSKSNVKLADFGMAQGQQYYEMKDMYRMLPVAGMTPEVFLYHLFCPQSDVWSFGILIWELLSVGGMPMEGLAMEDIQRRVTSPKPHHRYLPTPPHTPTALTAVMQSCWGLAYGTRPSMSELRRRLSALRLPSAAVPIPALPLPVPEEGGPVPADPEPPPPSRLVDAYPRKQSQSSLTAVGVGPDLSHSEARLVPAALVPRERTASLGYETPLNVSRSSSAAPDPEAFLRAHPVGLGDLPVQIHGSHKSSTSSSAGRDYYNSPAALRHLAKVSSDTIELDDSLEPPSDADVRFHSGRVSSSSGVSSAPYVRWRADVKEQRGAYI